VEEKRREGEKAQFEIGLGFSPPLLLSSTPFLAKPALSCFHDR
jgi:hypothetical protein